MSLPTSTEAAVLPPVEGTTTSEINVRAMPSTASASLGLIGIFVKVQVVGRDLSGSWYQIQYAESATGKGWVRAEYVQVDAAKEIQLVEAESSSGSAVSGLVTQKVNVRSGPGTTYESLGALNPNDVVSIIGRDAEGEWIQIEFAGASDGKGWLAAEFMQAADIENVPQVGTAEEAMPAPTVEVASPAGTAAQDDDSMQSPLAKVSFSPTGSQALQVNGDVSTDGDAEDWIQFSAPSNALSIRLTCSSPSLRAELWNNGMAMSNFSCGQASTANIQPGNDYFLRLIQNEAGSTDYVLNLEVMR